MFSTSGSVPLLASSRATCGVTIPRSCSFDGDVWQRKSIAVPRRTSFSTISVREYTQTLGDNPSCCAGAPITLDWAYHEKRPISLDEYEACRRKKRRRRSDLILGVIERRRLLVGNGVILPDIIRAEYRVSMKNGKGPIGMQLEAIKLPGQVKASNSNTYLGVLASRKSVVSRAA